MRKVTIGGKNGQKGQQVQKGKEQAGSRQKGRREQESVTACKKNPALQPNASRGTKRSRDGQEGPNSPQSAVKPTRPSGISKGVTKKNGSSKKSISNKDLLKEIMELGGTKDDLELVKDVYSDDENDVIEGGSTAKGRKDLRRDLEKLMAEVGHDLKKQQVVPDDKLSEEEVDGVEEEEGDNDEEDEEESEEAVGQRLNGTKVLETPSVPAKHTSGKLLFPPRPDWHAYELPILKPTGEHPSLSLIQSLHTRGKELLEAENKLYSTTHLVKTSDRQFLSTIMTSGTLSDKVSALTLICQESPLHATKTLETLLVLSKKKSRSQAVAALGAIKDLLSSGVVLPSDRKLKAFAKQAGLGFGAVTDLHLLVWTYEDWLKSFYFEVLKVLEGLCTDQLEFARSHAVGYVWELLKEKPEQEANLLRMLVNKLGDSDKKVSSKVSFLLLQLQQTHPAMKSIIINAIESEVLFRPGNSAHAKYYAIITLNQTIISSRDLEVANKLLDLYFAVFTGLLLKTRQSDKPIKTPAPKEIPPTNNGNAKGKLSKKAKRRLEEAERQTQNSEELNAKLISAVLVGVNRAYPFSKIDDELFEKHVDTLFRITHSGNFNTSIQALMLIHQVSTSKQVVSDRFYRTLYESLFDQRLITSSKQAMYLNLLFKALKVDTNLKRVKAFVKRLVQVSTMHQPAFICGVFYLLSELVSTFPSLRTMLDTPEAREDDEEEAFRDVPDEDDDVDKAKRVALEKAMKEAEDRAKKLRDLYDGRKRDPEFANADKSCLWEIIPFTYHFHPSVSLYASRFLYKQAMPNKPDLSLYTLTHFLDRFVFRNPTTRNTSRGHSIMQPLLSAGTEAKGMVLSIRGTGKTQQSINSEQFWTKNLEDVAPDEVFFHKYFNQRATATKNQKKKDKKKESEDEEEEIWSAMVGSRPEIEADGEDVDMDDLSEGEEGSDIGGSGDEGGEGEGSGEEGEAISLDAAIAASKRKPKSAAASEDDDDDGDASFGLGEEGSDVWASDDDVEVPSDIDMDLDSVFAAELETNNLAAEMPAPKKPNKKQGKKTSGPEEKDVGEQDEADDGVKKKKQKLKHLPTFVSADDYAHLLSD
ncbi:CBF-domain-containing protein [Terfezia boudieri ATCC MYA-4762]|uniref:CBF-domain-containing protein n=1 Tax=Terfezia boudieri ATCC MYA-4762 TaxID=1051890 RepID=A0A3N4LSL7_9PEZI|nr:CBF-domain-containing protein [Terfezia boudieri ATCC MYA-4762]